MCWISTTRSDNKIIKRREFFLLLMRREETDCLPAAGNLPVHRVRVCVHMCVFASVQPLIHVCRPPRPSFKHLGPADISGAAASLLAARQPGENSRVTDGSNSSRSAGLSGSLAPSLSCYRSRPRYLSCRGPGGSAPSSLQIAPSPARSLAVALSSLLSV